MVSRLRWRSIAIGLVVLVVVGCGGGPPGWPNFVDPPEGFSVRGAPGGQATCGPWELTPGSGVSDPTEALKAWMEATAGLERVDELRSGEVGFLGGFEGDEVSGGDRAPMYVVVRKERYSVSFCSG